MEKWEDIYLAMTDLSIEDNPMETEKARECFDRAYDIFVKPHYEGFSIAPITTGIDAETIFNEAVFTYQKAAFKAGFYAAMDVVLGK